MNMEELYNIQLSKVIDKFNLETLYLPDLPEKIYIDCSRVNRPGLQMAATYYEYYEHERLQIIGIMESQYLNTLDEDVRRERLNAFFA
jgi:HPr kinase/phosphorylase